MIAMLFIALAVIFVAMVATGTRLRLRMAAKKPTTYTSVSISSSNLPVKQVKLLVKENDHSVLETIELWNENSDLADESTIQRWVDDGQAFLSTAEGTRAIYRKEAAITKNLVSSKRPKRPIAVDVYVNAGTEE
jgi:hypothetical protein